MPGLLGEKMGMTQIYGENGRWIPVTVVKAGPCVIVQKKLKEKEGYSAIQVGFGNVKEKNVSKPVLGHFKKKQIVATRLLKEFRTDKAEKYQTGTSLTVDILKVGDMVDVTGISKGKGFQGVMKRHNFAGGRATHGCSVSHRAPGSIGQRTYPGKVFKNKKMAGQMGNEKVTVKNLKVVGIESEQGLVLIRGAIPGANHSFVTIRPQGVDVESRLPAPAAATEEAK